MNNAIENTMRQNKAYKKVSWSKYFAGKPQAVYGSILFLILVCWGIWMLPVMQGIIFPPDEYGYWANAAVMRGFDWTEVNGLNPYYSYGYSLTLLPIWKIGETHAYRIAICVNMLFVCLHGALLWKIMKKLFSRMDEKKRAVICLCGAVYPSVIVYMQYTLAEVMLNLVFLWLVWRVIRYVEALQTVRKDRTLYARAIVMALAAGLLYIVHMRTIGIWAALGAALLADAFLEKHKKTENLENDSAQARQKIRNRLSNRQKAALIFIGLSVVLFVSAEFVKDILQGKLYGDAGLDIIRVNDYGGRLERIGRLFTLSGFIDFVVSCAGKLFYLGNTTFGLYYFALALLWRKCRGKEEKWRLVWWFTAGAVVLNFGVSALGMSGSNRVDGLLYGRYNETVIPLMVCLGLIQIFRHTELCKKAVCIAALHGFLLGMVSIYASAKQLTTWLPDFAIGIACVAGQKPENVRQIFMAPYVTGLVGIAVLFLAVWLIQRREIAFEWVSVLSAVYLGIALIISVQNIRPHQRDNLGDMQIAETIQKLQQEEAGREVWLLHSEWNEYADSLQFFLPRQRIHVIPEEELDLFALDERDLIVTYKNDERDEALGMFYRMTERSWHLNLHYNP